MTDKHLLCVCEVRKGINHTMNLTEAGLGLMVQVKQAQAHACLWTKRQKYTHTRTYARRKLSKPMASGAS